MGCMCFSIQGGGRVGVQHHQTNSLCDEAVGPGQELQVIQLIANSVKDS